MTITTDFYNDYVVTMKDELERLSKSPKSPLPCAKMFKYLHGSISFLTSFIGVSTDGLLPEVIADWFAVTSEVLIVVYHQKEDFDSMQINIQKIVTCINHYLHNLVKIEGVPLDWYKYLGYTALELLACYSQSPSPQQDFITKSATNFYVLLAMVAQKSASASELGKRTTIEQVYELYLLASAIQSLDSTNSKRDSLKLAKDYMCSYTQLSAKANKKDIPGKISADTDALSNLFELAVKTFTLQSRSVTDESSLSYFVELFRLVNKDPALCEQLLNCDGNLYKLFTNTSTYFPNDGLLQLQHKNMKEQKENRFQDLMLTILRFMCQLKAAVEEEACQSSLTQLKQNSKKNKLTIKKSLSLSLELKVAEMMQSVFDCIETLLSESPKALPSIIGDCLSALVLQDIDTKQTKTESLIIVCKLASLSIEVFVRDIVTQAAKSSQASFVGLRSYSLAVANKLRLDALQALLNTERLKEVIGLQKSSLNALCVIAQSVRKTNLLLALPNIALQVTKTLDTALKNIGNLGRQLRRLEKNSMAIELLSPIWPVPSIEEIFPHVSHHETLAESYFQTSQPEKAYQVIAEAAKLHACLVTESLLKTLARMVKKGLPVPVLKLFEPCIPDDETKHAYLLGKALRSILMYSPSSQKCASVIAGCLSKHAALSQCEKAMYASLLAEITFFLNEQDKTSASCRDPLPMIKDATMELMSAPSAEYDDILAQSAFLYWEILHRATCLERASSPDDPPDLTLSPDPSQPNTVMTPSEPVFVDRQTPLDHATTPKRALTFSSPVQQRKKLKEKSKPKTPSETEIKVDSEILMNKAKDCLSVWTEWFDGHQADLLTWEDGAFRGERSLIFLQQVIELALVNHQLMTALEAICQARNLANIIKKIDMAKRLTGNLISLIAQLGIRYDNVSCLNDSGQDLFEEDSDIFMSGLGLDQDGHVMDLVAIADHYIRAGERNKFKAVRGVVLEMIEKAKDKGPLTPSSSLALATISRLSAEFDALSQRKEESVSEDSKSYPIVSVGNSLKYITSVAAYYFGNNYSNAESRAPSLNSWQVIHEYLCTLKLSGELFMHIGNIKYARTHFMEGLKMSKSCLLMAWSAIFLCKLVHVALHYNATTKVAQSYLKKALQLVDKHCLTTEGVKSDQSAAQRKFVKSCIGDQKFSCRIHSNGNKTQPASLCHDSDTSAIRQRLLAPSSLEVFALDMNIQDSDDGDDDELKFCCCDVACSHCFHVELAQVCIQLMWYQAEISLRNQGPYDSIIESFRTASCTAQQLAQLSMKNCVGKLLEKNGLPLCFSEHVINKNIALLLETQVKLSEFYFQAMYVQSYNSVRTEEVTEEEVGDLLDSIITKGKQLNGAANSNLLVASAQLLRVHLRYLSDMRRFEEESVAKSRDENSSDEHVINFEAQENIGFSQHWNDQKVLEFKNKTVMDSSSTPLGGGGRKPLKLARSESSSAIKVAKTSKKADPTPKTPLSEVSNRRTRKTAAKVVPIYDDLKDPLPAVKPRGRPRGKKTKAQENCQEDVPPTKGRRGRKNKNIEDVEEELRSDVVQAQCPTAIAASQHAGELQECLHRLEHFPPSFVYSQLCRSLVLEEWSSATVDAKSKSQCDHVNQMRTAALLTDSMHVTFQHLMTRNLLTKLRKCEESKAKVKDEPSDWDRFQGHDRVTEVKAMSDTLNELKTGFNLDRFKDKLAHIPADWTVLQMTCVNYDPLNPGRGSIFMTRMTSDLEPLTLELPHSRWNSLMAAMRVYEEAIVHDLKPEEYWPVRFKKDAEMKNIVVFLQEVVLSAHKWLMRGRVGLVGGKTVAELLETPVRSTVELVQKQTGFSLDRNTVRVIFEVLLCAHEKDLESLMDAVWPPKVAQLVKQTFLEVQVEVAQLCGSVVEVTRGPVVLVLDKTLNKLPWESMPEMLSETVSRVPSLSSLLALLTLHKQKKDSSFRCGVKRDSVVALVDPETNLSNAVNVLLPQIQGFKGWSCLAQKAPTVANLKDFLTNYDLYLYSGHGWGNQFVGGDDLQMFHAKAVAVVMGCSSGRLDYKPRLDGDGGPLYFLLAGCPTVMGNLWVVTDKDIDKFTLKLVTEWMAQDRPVPLSDLLKQARQVCRLVGLNGFAPVIYGLPIMMNN